MAKKTESNTNVSATQDPKVVVSQDPANVDPTPNGAAPVIPETPDATPGKTFSQADLDRIVKDRLEREKGKFSDYAELKKAADKLKTIEDEQKSDLEKLQEQVMALTDKTTKTAAENIRLKLNAKIATIAGSMGAVDPYDANFQLATQAIDPDGDGADDQIKTSIEELKAQRPYLFGKAQPHVEPFNPDGGPGNPPQETDAQRAGRIYGGGGSIWDPATAKRLGGGVVAPPGWDKE